ncbi:hypothetical protein Tco_1050483, partial [Tanacetum coccineum]
GSQSKVLDEQEDKTIGTDEGTSTKPGVLGVPKYLSESENESWGDSGDDERNDDDSDEVTNDDDDDDVDSDADANKEAKEEFEEECVHTPNSVEFTNDDEEYEELYKDVNIRLQATEHEEEGKGFIELTNADRDDSTQQTTYEQVKDDEHVILTTVHDTQKTKVPLQISFVSSDFANQFLNLDNALPTDTEVVSIMNVQVRHEEPSTQTPPLLNIPITVILKTLAVTRSTIPPTILPITPLPQQSIPTPTPALTTVTTTTSIPALLDFSSLFGFDQRVSALEKESYTTEFKKKAKDDRKRYIDLVEKSMKDIIKDEVKSQLPLILPKELDKELFGSYGKVYSLKRDREDKDKDKDPPAGSDQGLKKQKTCKDVEPSRGSKSKESKSSSSKGTKSQPKSSGKSAQVEEQCLQVVPGNYFINNNLEYLKGGSSSRKYTTSITKTKVAKYDTIVGIEDMVPSLWSPVKWYDYRYLEEIVVRREDQQLYKFKECDFSRLNLRDIEDLLLLLVQKKLSNLEKDVIYDLNVALRMSDVTNITPYTAYNNLQGIIYLDKFKRNRLMRLDELYQFCDGTLTYVQRVLHDIASSLEMDYFPKRRWSKLDRKRSCIMIKAIDQQLFKRR